MGILSGFDRIVFRGMFRNLLYSAGMASYLNFKGILLKDFDTFVYAQTNYLRISLYKYVENMKRPVIYLESSSIRKEKKVQEILHKNPIDTGLICLLTCIEPCKSYQIYKNPQSHIMELKSRIGKCLFLYFYYRHEGYGLMHIAAEKPQPIYYSARFSSQDAKNYNTVYCSIFNLFWLQVEMLQYANCGFFGCIRFLSKIFEKNEDFWDYSIKRIQIERLL